MSFSLPTFLNNVCLGEPVEKDNLILFPLFLSETEAGFKFLLLDEAMSLGLIEIGEVSEEGSVNTVRINNKGEHPVLILDGDQLIGAKQNRIANAAVMVSPGSEIIFSVSCVERGRWSYKTSSFKHDDSFGYSDLRARKAAYVASNLKKGLGYTSNQRAIWDEVDRKHIRMKTSSPTGDLHSIYEKYTGELNSFVENLAPFPEQVGMAVFINNRFVCMDVFSDPETMGKAWQRLLKSYAMDAIEQKGKRADTKTLDPVAVFESVKRTELSYKPSQGLGEDIRLESESLIGAGLVLEDRLIHLSVFARRNNDPEIRRQADPYRAAQHESRSRNIRSMQREGLPNLIAHADWGSTQNNRVLAKAWLQSDSSYLAEGLVNVHSPGGLLQTLRHKAGSYGAILAGFDFPIGLPISYAKQAGINDFIKELSKLGFGEWDEFYNIAQHPDQISITRPFYPLVPGGTMQIHLVNGLGVGNFNELRRRCELDGQGMHAATPLFWTLGAGQVGKGAIIGWRDMLAPALRSGEMDIKIWPFQGTLSELIANGRTVVTETYPSEFRHHLGIGNGSTQESRIACSDFILELARSVGLIVPDELQAHIRNGFGNGQNARDQFDAFVGLLGMLNVIRGNRPEGVPHDDTVLNIEGWIMGKIEG